MLALARGEGQSIIIDGHIEVKVVKWSRSSVRLAIQAPREVTVDRDEIWRKAHPGEMTPLEKAEIERNERFAREAAQGGRQPPAAGEGAGIVEIGAMAVVEGVFYSSAGPGGSPYVQVGSAVEQGALLGSIKGSDGAMMDVQAPAAGKVTRIAVGNGQTVKVGQLLMTIAPAEM
ncbi:MAG TPA: carbon storage regulator [Phycisphaerae bacterium]|jgi:carbon storage regulator CsrA